MSGHLSDNDILSLVHESSNDVADKSIVIHLEDCGTCQHRLASLSGEGEWLAELKHVLRSESNCAESNSTEANAPPSVSVFLDGSATDQQTIDASRLKLDFLESPRHPELLGRLGRYDVERLIGVGGFGIVFKAFDTELHRTVALKVLSPHLMTSGAARKRFAREAQAAAAIHHENVIPIFDVKVEQRVVYLVMPFVSGSSLQERVDRDGPLSIEEILRVGAQIAAGLAAAHKQGVIHRDVKPANVLLESSLDRVIISDFGLAQTTDDASLTRSGVITGTPHYMSPEQAMGDAVDDRSDLFSLGSVLYFMCSGRSPFRAKQILAVLNQISRKEPKSLDSVRTDIPFELQTLIANLLKKSPGKRPNSAEDVCNTLTRLLHAYQHGKLRRTPTTRSIKRAAVFGALAISTLAVAAAAWPILFPGDTQEEQTTGSTENLTESIHASDAVQPFAPQTSPDQQSAPDQETVDGSFYSELAETISLLRKAESRYDSPHSQLPSIDAKWHRDFDEMENNLNSIEALYDREFNALQRPMEN